MLKINKFYFLIPFVALLFSVANSFAQVTVSQTGTVAQWVQNVLVGQGVTVSNVTYTGDLQAIGTFTTGTTPSNLGFPSGIIMSSGNATDAAGYNSSGSTTTNTSGGSDTDLANLISTQPTNIKDAAVLEFDFIPVSDTVRFRYVFGSDEYPEFVNSSYNDVFGFFVSGLNPYGGFYTNQNIALIPGTTTPVSINNVNNGTASAGPCQNCAYYVNNLGGTTIEYDGMTTVLTAWIKVIPCLTYHIKLAIADVGDESYDSGVFLEANSFMSNSVLIDQTTSSSIDTSAVEGCNDAVLTFRLPHPVGTNTIINFLAGGTATNGVDYNNIGNQITIPAGQDSVNMVISPIFDGLIEPVEFIRLIVSTSACTYDTIYVFIKDNQPVLADVSSDTVLCGGQQSIPIQASGSGGYSPYSFSWSTGDTTDQIMINPMVTTQYTVTVTDLCNNDTTTSMWVKVSEPDFSLQGDTICKGETATLAVLPNMPLTYSWNTGSTTAQISGNPSVTTIYTVRITDTLGCFVDTTVEAKVYPLPQLTLSPDASICMGDQVDIWVKGALSYLWSNGSVDSNLSVSPNSSTTYSVTATDANQCVSDSSVFVEVLAVPDAQISTNMDTICRGATAILTASGGDQYIWSTGSSSSSIEVNPLVNTLYSVIASYSSAQINCSDTATFVQPVKRCNRFYVPSAFTPNGDGLNDYFGVIGVFKNIDNFNLTIYNRWGDIVYQTNDVLKPWDGKINGENAPNAAYTYRVVIRETFSEEYVLAGTLHLVR